MKTACVTQSNTKYRSINMLLRCLNAAAHIPRDRLRGAAVDGASRLSPYVSDK